MRTRIAVLVPAALLLCQNLAGLEELMNRKKMGAIFLVALGVEGFIWTRRWLEGGQPNDDRPPAHREEAELGATTARPA